MIVYFVMLHHYGRVVAQHACNHDELIFAICEVLANVILSIVLCGLDYG